MNAGDERGTAMKRPVRLIACLVAAVLATSCTVVKIKYLDAQALAAKGRRGKIVSVQSADASVVYNFSKDDPAIVKDGAIFGNTHSLRTFDLFEVAEIALGAAGPRIVLKDGSRFQATASRAQDERIECEAVKTVWIPLDEVGSAKVRTDNAAAAVFNAFAGIALVAGALVIDAVTYGADVPDFDETLTGSLIGSLFESGGTAGGGSGRRRSNKALLGEKESYDTAGETEFWTMEWTPVEARAGEDGKIRVPVDNRSGVPRGIDEAKLVVVDHPPGVSVAPDVLGTVRSFSAPVAPESAADGIERDIKDLVSAGDGVLWRTPGRDPAAVETPPLRDEITLSFHRPKGSRSTKLIVKAANSAWRAEFAREVQARGSPAAGEKNAKGKANKAGPVYQEWEYAKIRVRMLTVNSWQTAQALFAAGPLPPADMIYNLDLSDVGTDKVWLKLTLPAGYWLFDRLALDFGQDVPVEAIEAAAEEVDGPDAAEVLQALAAEDSTTLHLGTEDPPALLTFTLPPPKEGMARSVFLRTVSCYEMPPYAKDRKKG